MWRAIRLVIDTGIHSFGWSRQQAIDYFKANSAKTENGHHGRSRPVHRVAGSGAGVQERELEIKALRKYAEQQLGSKFDIRAFHDQILGQGHCRSTSSIHGSGRGWTRTKANEDYRPGAFGGAAGGCGLDLKRIWRSPMNS